MGFSGLAWVSLGFAGLFLNPLGFVGFLNNPLGFVGFCGTRRKPPGFHSVKGWVPVWFSFLIRLKNVLEMF